MLIYNEGKNKYKNSIEKIIKIQKKVLTQKHKRVKIRKYHLGTQKIRKKLVKRTRQN